MQWPVGQVYALNPEHLTSKVKRCSFLRVETTYQEHDLMCLPSTESSIANRRRGPGIAGREQRVRYPAPAPGSIRR